MSHSVQNAQPGSLRTMYALLIFCGAVGATMFALTAGGPAANADTVELPDFPDFASGNPFDIEPLGEPPLVGGVAFQDTGTYVNLLGQHIDTGDGDPAFADAFSVNVYGIPGTGSAGDLEDLVYLPYGLPENNPGIEAMTIIDPSQYIDFIPGNPEVDGSTFNAVVTASGWESLYEETPSYFGGVETQNISDTLLFDPTGSPLADLSGIEFGIQYVDLPDAATPVDAVNFLGSGGEILFSIPVTGDLLSLF